uniref:Uncharacterized protein n=1 Tax=Panagrolaimus sp. ES5 TaxID=591445 RepID=A0AC34FUL2_9BILA
MSNTPTPPPPTAPATAPAVRFRVVSGSDLVKRSKSPQVAQNFQSQPPPQRIRYARPGERFVYARPPPNYHIQRNELQFSQQNQPIPVRRAIPTIIRQPITRIIRPINPQQNGNADNKKKLVTILRSFLTRCATTPTESNMSQMIITTE